MRRVSDLDKVSKEIPIFITRVCYHIAVLNSKAMEILGITKASVQKYDKMIGTNPD
jgi:predicted amidohydrolase YtcJ